MFTESARLGCSVPACYNGSAKCQTCLIFHQPTMTLYLDLGSADLEAVLSWISVACRSQFRSCPILLLSYMAGVSSLSKVVSLYLTTYTH